MSRVRFASPLRVIPSNPRVGQKKIKRFLYSVRFAELTQFSWLAPTPFFALAFLKELGPCPFTEYALG